jgi:cytoskeletal protein CcmA (bactofilin family)
MVSSRTSSSQSARPEFDVTNRLEGDDLVRHNIAETIGRLADDDDVKKLAVIGIGRVLFRHHKNNGNWGDVFDAYLTEIRHVIDWLVSSVHDKDEWLLRKDAKERPLKLMKMHSIPQLVAEADKAFAKKTQKVRAVSVLPDDERLHMRLDDGYTVVRMLTPEALDRETFVMQHCIGHGSYDRYLQDENHGLYSLRDPFNHPHATIEVNGRTKSLLQLRGKQNEMPISKYLKLLAPFIASEGLISGETARVGFVIGTGGIVYHTSEIPDGAEFDGTVSFLGSSENPNDIRLPTGIMIDGDLVLEDGFQGLLSMAATVKGDVHARGMILPDLSRDFHFEGGLHLEGSWVGVLPDGLHIRGDLVLKHCQKVVLPRGLLIDGDLDLTSANVAELPSDIVVGKSLHLGSSTIQTLPAGISVGGGVFLGGTKQLEEIPTGFTVGGNLMLRDSSVRRIAEDVVVGGMVSINADIAGELDIAATAKLDGGLYFRPTARARNFEGRSAMTADEVKGRYMQESRHDTAPSRSFG